MALDDDFFRDLDDKLTSVGSDEVWKRNIGNRNIWFSPVTFKGQSEVRSLMEEANNTMSLGSNIIAEAQRKTLSHAIVGIDDISFLPYRNSSHVFPMEDPRLGKVVKVDLSSYIYHKMGDWGDQFLDDVFKVFTDLIGTHEKNNLKNIIFENSRDPKEEHDDLYGRLIEIRQRLGLPELVESKGKNVAPHIDIQDDENGDTQKEELEELPMDIPSPTPPVKLSIEEKFGVKISHRSGDDDPIEEKTKSSANPRFPSRA
jgi:hypothetical protein